MPPDILHARKACKDKSKVQLTQSKLKLASGAEGLVPKQFSREAILLAIMKFVACDNQVGADPDENDKTGFDSMLIV